MLTNHVSESPVQFRFDQEDVVHRDLCIPGDLDARLADIANRERISVNMVIVQLLQQEMAAASSQEGQKTEG